MLASKSIGLSSSSSSVYSRSFSAAFGSTSSKVTVIKLIDRYIIHRLIGNNNIPITNSPAYPSIWAPVPKMIEPIKKAAIVKIIETTKENTA